jgi:hypothetical protein
MSLGASEEVRFYGNLIKNNLFGAKYDLHKIPGPPGYWLAGACICTEAHPHPMRQHRP